MVTEAFLNSCFSVILNDQKIPKTVYRDISAILSFYKKKEKQDVAIPIKNKLDCLEKACEMKMQDKTNDNIIDNLLAGEKFKPLGDFITMKLHEEIPEKDLKDIIEQIRMRKKFITMFPDYDKFATLMETIKNGNFDCLQDIVFDYENQVKRMYSGLMENSRATDIETSASLDLVKDDFASVLDQLKKKFDTSNVVPTGFSIFDNNILRGGFEKTRLYIFAGGSGSGKSTIMTNCIENGLAVPRVTNGKQVYVYITLENLVDETLMRMYQSMFNRTTPQFIFEIQTSSPDSIKKKLVDKIEQSNSTVVAKYFPKFSISPTDIMMVLDDIKSQYGEDSIRALFVDYLDLLKIDGKYELYRLELSHITSYLKDIAVTYNIPVITASQLNRGVYDKNPDAKELTLSMMSESIKKVEHADFIAIMAKDSTEDNLVHMKIGKNRNGVVNTSIDFKVDFSKYKFMQGYEVNNNSDQVHKPGEAAPWDIANLENTSKEDVPQQTTVDLDYTKKTRGSLDSL